MERLSFWGPTLPPTTTPPTTQPPTTQPPTTQPPTTQPPTTQPPPTPPTAGFGSAIRFDGANDYVAGPSAAAASGHVTLEGWVKWRGDPSHSGLVFYNGNTANSGYGLYYTAGGSLYILCGGIAAVGPAATMATNRWQHMAIVFDGAWRMYIDGAEQTVPGNSGFIAPATRLVIGGNVGGAEAFDGSIDEVRVWKTPLSLATLTNWMWREADATHPQWPNLVAYYKFNEGSGTTAADFMGGAHNATLYNEPAWAPSVAREWTGDAGLPLTGSFIGSDVNGASRDGEDWALRFEPVSQGRKGTVRIPTNNVFVYRSRAGQEGPDAFTYRVIDPQTNVSNVATAHVFTARPENLLVAWGFEGMAGDEPAADAALVSPRLGPATIRRGPNAPAPAKESDGFWSTNWPALGFSDTHYLEFPLTPKPGYWLSPTTVCVQSWAPFPGDPTYMHWRLRSDRDGFTTNLAEWACTNTSGAATNVLNTVVLPEDFQDLRTTVVFRLYGYAGGSGSNGGLKGPGFDLAVHGRAGYGEAVYKGALLTWDFAGSAGNEATIPETERQSNLLSSAVSRGPGLSTGTRANSFTATQWDSYLAGDYLAFPVNVKPGYACAVTGLSIRTFTDQGGIHWHLRSDRDGYGTDLDAWLQAEGATAWVHQVFLNDASLAHMTTAAVFRLYGENGSGGTNVSLQSLSDNPALIVWGSLWFDDAGDVDGDGMPNAWERIGTGSATGAAAGADFDGDLVPDDEEWVADTNPGDRESFLRITRVARPNSFTLTFPCSVDRIYRLMTATDLAAPVTWAPAPGLADMPGETGGTMSITDTNNAARGFYRVGVSVP